MAAMRSVLAMLGRRCGSSGSSGAAFMGGRGLEIHQAFRPAAPKMSPFQPAAARNSGGWRCFSTAGRERANNAEGGLRMWWQRARNRVKNANVAESSKAVFVYSAVTVGASTCYVVKSMWDIILRP